MAVEEKIFPYKGVNLNVHESLVDNQTARFIKNLIYEVTDTADATASRGAQTGVGKPLQSNSQYIENLTLPDGYNHTIGAFAFKQTKQVFVFLFNDESNHTVYVLNGGDQSFNIIKQGGIWNFQLDPEKFVHNGGCWLQVIYVEDPDTGLPKKRSFLIFTDGFNPQRQVCIEDAIATNGFDPNEFPYFRGDYDPEIPFNMGVPTSMDCVQITEIPRTPADVGANNNILFNTWQIRITPIDVWGRPAEHGIISDIYIPGINDCVAASNSLARCLNLNFSAGNPFWDKVQVEFRNCNSLQWYLDQVLFLYVGSNLGEWWKRQRNPDINYVAATNTINYTFCRDKECNPIPQNETNRLDNPLPRSSQAVAKLNQFLSVINNKSGFTPFAKSITDKIKFNITPPKVETVNSRTITIYVPIWNEALDNFQSVRADGTNGFIWGDNNSKHGGARNYLQYFTNIQQSGFPGYLLGDGNLAFSTQVYVDGNGNINDDPEHLGQNLSPAQFTMQKFVYNNVPSGIYIFRLASHLSDPSVSGDFESTSTTVWGVCPFNKSLLTGNPNNSVSPEQRRHSQELIINVCDGDYNTLNQTEILVIADLAAEHTENIPGQLVPITGFNSISSAYKATSGYIYETRQNGFNQNPMELMSVIGQNGITSLITDHNGFYYFSTAGTGRSFVFDFYYKCQISQFSMTEGNTGMRLSNHWLDEERHGVNAFPFGDFFTTPCNRILIKGQAFLTDKNIGIPGATIVLSRGGTTATDDDGNFTLIAHDEVGVPQRNDILIFANGVCNYLGVDGVCVPVKNIVIIHCATCILRTLLVGQYLLTYNIQRGLLSGGVYGMGVTGWDWLKRATFVQPLGYLNIPSVIQSQAIGPSTVEVSIPPDTVFPPETTEITFWITAETTLAEYLTWIVDRFDLIDNTGNINVVAPTQIRIYYASLIEYNKQNNFNTTTAWNFIPQGQNIPVTSDKVQFLMNGDGKFFAKTIIGLVKYDQVGQFLLIDYTPDLAGLIANGVIRLMRPKVCTGNEPYFEICHSVKIINGVAQENKFILNAFDTYYLSRQIPVPIPVTPTPAVQSIATTEPISGGGTQTTTVTPVPVATADAQRIFGFRFEHNSPSNFWGQGCANFGRVNVKNPYEAVIFLQNEIALSGTLSINGQLNYLNYFDGANKFSFDINTLNGIVAVFTQNSILILVGQNDNATVGFNDDIPVVNAQGQLTIPSGKDQFGNPQPSIGGRYGCQLFDKSTLCMKDGLVQFLDSTSMAVIQHNFRQGYPISTNNSDGYIRAKVASVNKYNLSALNKRYFVGAIDEASNSYLLTDYIIKSNNFLNTLREENVDVQETVVYGIYSKAFKGWLGFTPENMCSIEGEFNDNQLFTFKNGVPWKHYSLTDQTDYGSIYGTVVESIFDVIVVIDPMKKKKPLSIAQYINGGMYFCDQATTPTQQTRMLISAWLEANYGFFAPFLCDLNTLPDKNIPDQTGKNKLMDGNILVGNWIRVRLVSSPDTQTVYHELQGITVSIMAAEKS